MAFITGDYAKGKDTGIIDLVIVGEINEKNLHELGKYIYEEMFDRKDDKTELNNLVGSSGFYDLKTSLVQKTENYIKELK